MVGLWASYDGSRGPAPPGSGLARGRSTRRLRTQGTHPRPSLLLQTRARTSATAGTRRTDAKNDGDENQAPAQAQAKAVVAKKLNVLQDKAAPNKPAALGDKNVPAKAALQSKSTNAVAPAGHAAGVKKVATVAPVKSAAERAAPLAAAGRKPLGEVGNVHQQQVSILI